jgi:Tfp pilus assembly protein PilO
MKLFGKNIGGDSKKKTKSSQDLSMQVKKVGQVVGKFKLLLVMLAFLVSLSYMLLQIRTLSDVKPTDEQETEATASIKKVRIKKEDITRIEALKDTNVEVKAIFDENRTNPFK